MGKNLSAEAVEAVMPVAMEPIAAVFKKVRLFIPFSFSYG